MLSVAAIIVLVILIFVLFILIGVAVWYFITSTPTTSTPTIPSSVPITNTTTSMISDFTGSVPKGIVESEEELLATVPEENLIKYGDVVRIKNIDATLGGYLSPCGSAGSECGLNVTIRPEVSYQAEGGDRSKLRDWTIEGGAPGANIQYGDIIQIKGPTTSYTGSDLYLTPCGAQDSSTGCVNVTLMTNQTFQTNGGNVRNWEITGGVRGQNIPYTSSVVLTAKPLTWVAGWNKPLSLCGTNGVCGSNVALRSDFLYNTWQIEKAPLLTESGMPTSSPQITSPTTSPSSSQQNIASRGGRGGRGGRQADR